MITLILLYLCILAAVGVMAPADLYWAHKWDKERRDGKRD